MFEGGRVYSFKYSGEHGDKQHDQQTGVDKAGDEIDHADVTDDPEPVRFAEIGRIKRRQRNNVPQNLKERIEEEEKEDHPTGRSSVDAASPK